MRRGLASERNAESCRRRECAGCAAATEVSISEAFWGRTVGSLAARRVACRRRWGRSTFAAAGADSDGDGNDDDCGGSHAADAPVLGREDGLWAICSCSDRVLELK